MHRDKIRVWNDKCREKSLRIALESLGANITTTQDHMLNSFIKLIQAIKTMSILDLHGLKITCMFLAMVKKLSLKTFQLLECVFLLECFALCCLHVAALLYCCVSYVIINKRYIYPF